MNILAEVSAIQGRIAALDGADETLGMNTASSGSSGLNAAPADPQAQATFRNMMNQALGRLGSLGESVGYGNGAEIATPSQLEPMISKSAGAFGVSPDLVKAVIANESGFQTNAVSPVGAQGLMQLMPGTAASLGVSNSFDASQNIAGGTRYLRGLYDRFGDWKMAVAAYNAGPGAVAKYGGIPPYHETQQYVSNVMDSYNRYQAKSLSESQSRNISMISR
jgi:soluble lytic murein transglycosylase-like protein